MNIELTGRHVRITANIEAYARAKAEKVTKFLKDGARVQVVLDHEHDQYQVEMIVSGFRGPNIIASVSHDDANAAVDLTIDKIEQQLRKLKDRKKHHHGESMAGEDHAPGGGDLVDHGLVDDDDDGKE